MLEDRRNKFERILKNDVPSIEGKKIVIWGMGNTARLYQQCFIRLESEGFEISAYCDSSVKDGGKAGLFYGKPVLSPSELRKQEDICVLVCTPTPDTIKEIGNKLDSMGMEWRLLDEVILKMHAKQVMACYDLMADDKSKEVYADVITAHLKGEYLQEEQESLSDAYFALKPFCSENENEVFVDCGSWVGDTIERFIWKRSGLFKKIIAFEPDPVNYQAMTTRVKRLNAEWNFPEGKVLAYPYGIADKEQEGVFETYGNGLGSKFVGGGIKPAGKDLCRMVNLDSFIKEPYSFLKADIESYEYRMLLGAKDGIQKWKPKIAVCIYHNAADLYEVPLAIYAMEGDYHMAVRHHSGTLADTVLYCWMD